MAKTPLPPVSVSQPQLSPIVETAPSQIDKEFAEINQQFSQLNLQYQQQQSTSESVTQQSYYGGETVPTEVPNVGYSQGSVQEPTKDVNSYSQAQPEYQASESQYNNYSQPQPDQVDQSNYYGGSYAGYDQQHSLGYDSMQQQQQNSYDYYGQQSLGANDEVSGVWATALHALMFFFIILWFYFIQSILHQVYLRRLSFQNL